MWTRHWPDGPRHWESITLAEEAMTHCETRLTDREYGLHLLCGVAVSLGPCSEGKKEHLSAFAFFFQQHAKNSSAGTEQRKAFDWWCLTHLRVISYRSLIYLHVSSREGPGAKPWTQTPQAFRKFRFSCINCLLPILPITVNLLSPSIPCSLRPLPNKPSPE